MSFAKLLASADKLSKQSSAAIAQQREASLAAEQEARRKREAEEARRRQHREEQLQRTREDALRRAEEDARLQEMREKKLAEARAAREASASSEPASKKRKLGHTSTSPPARPRQISQIKMERHRSSSPAATDPSRVHVVDSMSIAPSSTLHGKSHIRASFDPTACYQLQKVKKDIRTVDEIERDIKAQKGGGDRPLFFFNSPAQSSREASPAPIDMQKNQDPHISTSKAAQASLKPIVAQGSLSRTGGAISATSSAAQVLDSGQLLPPVKRRSSSANLVSKAQKGAQIAASPSSAQRAKKKANRNQSPPPTYILPPKATSPTPMFTSNGPGTTSMLDAHKGRSDMAREDHRNTIRNTFSRNQSDYTPRPSDSEDSSDMEGGARDILDEESRAEKMARREDERESALLAQRKREKEERKAGKQRVV